MNADDRKALKTRIGDALLFAKDAKERLDKEPFPIHQDLIAAYSYVAAACGYLESALETIPDA